MHRLLLPALSSLLLAAVAYAQAPMGGAARQRGGLAAPEYHTGQLGDEAVITAAGDHVDIVYDASQRSFYAFHVLRDGRRAVLADGDYNLTNGGAIRVSGNGHVIWDAFGVVQRVLRSAAAHPGNDKG